MQKKMIALAVAGLASTAAFAQSNVTLYGIADLGQAWVKSSGAKAAIYDKTTDTYGPDIKDNQRTVGRLDSNSSYLGFKGVEDLGNGLKAVFQYETAISADTNKGFTGMRDSYVGLAGNFGTVVAGRLTHPLREMGIKVDILPGDAGIGTVNSVTGQIAGVKTGADDRASNAVAYISPTFGGGFSVTAAWVNGERHGFDDDGEKANARAWQIAGKYDNGPLFVGLGYHKTKDNVTNDVDGQIFFKGLNARVWRLAAVYTAPFGTKFSALYDNTKVEEYGFGDVKRHAWSVGASHPFGANTVGLQYARSGKTKESGEPSWKDSANIWTAYYGYSLSKRTQLHARYTRLANGKEGDFNFYNNPVNNGRAASAPEDDRWNAKYTGFMVGLRHSF